MTLDILGVDIEQIKYFQINFSFMTLPNKFTGPIIAICLASVFITGVTVLPDQANNQSNLEANLVFDLCPDDNPKARDLLKKFLTSSSYYNARAEAGVNDLSTDQIKVLSDSNSTDQQICEELNSTYSSKDFPSRVTTYYKVGNFYFVSRPLIQNPGSDYVIMGPNFMDILDPNQNLIKKIDM